MTLLDDLRQLVDVPRSAWGARPSARARRLWPLGAPSNLEVHHSVTPSNEQLESACRRIQRDHLNRGWADAFYNVALHQDGRVAELAPWGRISGSGLPAFTVCLLGNYEHDHMTPAQAAKLEEFYRLLPNHFTYHQERAKLLSQPATACCGRNAIVWVQLRRLGPPSPVPAPEPDPVWVSHELIVAQEGDVVSKLVSVPGTDGSGNGWVSVNFGGKATAVVGVAHHGPYPPVDGYWLVEGQLSAQVRGGNVYVTVTGASPNRSPFNVWVSALVKE